ncbi:rRNA N-glycosidase [Striga asiatica]|uniref:rRNA N-glycosidase n=1 Tax=Striga asiatica TaxID=4170 RepID=A0A5A7R6X2_STRAF|nr:rRNA N-glycosidase [Striga asiatica]
MTLGNEGIHYAVRLLTISTDYDGNDYRRSLLSIIYHLLEAARFKVIERFICQHFALGRIPMESHLKLLNFWGKASKAIILNNRNVKFSTEDGEAEVGQESPIKNFDDAKLKLDLLLNYSKNDPALPSIEGVTRRIFLLLEVTLLTRKRKEKARGKEVGRGRALAGRPVTVLVKEGVEV